MAQSPAGQMAAPGPPLFTLGTVRPQTQEAALVPNSNKRQARPRDRISDPFRPIIGAALNSYLHAYHLYRAEALRVLEIERLDTISRNALESLQRVFPYGVRYKNGTFRSWFCTEKPHSMTHWADNYSTVGCIRIISTSVTESRMKTAVKTPSRKTNNQASFGGSLLKNNMEVEAAMELKRPGTWTKPVCTEFAPFMSISSFGLHRVRLRFANWTKVYTEKKSLLSVNFFVILFAPSLHSLHQVYTEFIQSSHQNGPFFWGNPPVLKCVNFL